MSAEYANFLIINLCIVGQRASSSRDDKIFPTRSSVIFKVAVEPEGNIHKSITLCINCVDWMAVLWVDQHPVIEKTAFQFLVLHPLLTLKMTTALDSEDDLTTQVVKMSLTTNTLTTLTQSCKKNN